MRAPTSKQFVVDCEYSGETHQLISMAIVPLWPKLDEFGTALKISKPLADEAREFYEVIAPLPRDMSPWVQENVAPHLNKEGIPYEEFQRKLESFLLAQDVWGLHYDWCDDIAYFNRAMITGPGERIKIPHAYLTHTHHPDIEVKSEVAHNALHDARAIAAEIRLRLR